MNTSRRSWHSHEVVVATPNGVSPNVDMMSLRPEMVGGNDSALAQDTEKDYGSIPASIHARSRVTCSGDQAASSTGGGMRFAEIES